MLARDNRVVILGDWINTFSYAVYDGNQLILDRFIEGGVIE